MDVRIDELSTTEVHGLTAEDVDRIADRVRARLAADDADRRALRRELDPRSVVEMQRDAERG
ncbi:hypothetical protein Xcel_1956 [Xylanimonas cellulosilytica DSM 15894]|uniref:Uncharacterized protein n=1 Tax=Xylanimonas cellulosilytica (strain DSM 15894 / JCM 12276 / CECT 5975 / KCTC 9989 / LMG 20990 / NBRC 107835 / XIL07) TaxID=446471 RepID=D1BTJ6_XYLCX|nr:hypothetical protein [Xylanimonas cellulosilytica]ACZ30975.1 hypothetical protein Xcel_1956 [Xylanimonas cellulosilytica DSM 15894]